MKINSENPVSSATNLKIVIQEENCDNLLSSEQNKINRAKLIGNNLV